MFMKKTNKKRGFTITELVVVVSVIAILSAVLIPTFSGIIAKSKLSADKQVVRGMNTVLSTMIGDNDEVSYNDVADLLEEEGYNISDKDCWAPSTKGYAAYWVQAKKTIVLVESGKVIYPENMKNYTLGDKDLELSAGNYVAVIDNATAGTATVAKDAIEKALENGNNVKLTQKYDEPIVVESNLIIKKGASLEVDLGGNTITSTATDGGARHAYVFDVYGELTVSNAKVEARGVQVRKGGVMTLNNIEVTAIDSNGGAAVYVYEGGKAVINGGTYTNSAVSSVELQGATAVISYGDLEINGGVFTATAGVYAVAIYGGNATIKNATITGARGGISVDGANKVTIEKCTVVSNWTTNTSCYALYVSAGNVTATNSTFTAANDQPFYKGGTATITVDGTAI